MRGNSPRTAEEPSSAPSPDRVEPRSGSRARQDPSPDRIDLRRESSPGLQRPRTGSERGAPSGGDWALVRRGGGWAGRAEAAAAMKFPGSVLVSLVLFMSETAAALCLSAWYHHAGDRMWQTLTLLFALLPCALVQLSLVFIHRDVSRDRPLVLLLHLLQLGPLVRSVSPCCLQQAGAGAGPGPSPEVPGAPRPLCGAGGAAPALHRPGPRARPAAAAGGTAFFGNASGTNLRVTPGERGSALPGRGEAATSPPRPSLRWVCSPVASCRLLCLFAAASSTALCSQIASKREREHLHSVASLEQR